MKRLVIVGAGGCGREVFSWAKDINRKDMRWAEIEFISDSLTALDGKMCEASIISTVTDYEPKCSDEFVCAIGNGEVRKRIMCELKAKGANFINLIHPTAIVSDSAHLGIGVIVYPYSLVTADATVGDGCIINMHCSVAHDVIMGDFCTISPNCHIAGNCTLSDNVFMGIGSNIIPSIKVGDNAYICAGSTVMTRIKSDSKVIGTPAQKVRGW